jgi:hypothetical protein
LSSIKIKVTNHILSLVLCTLEPSSGYFISWWQIPRCALDKFQLCANHKCTDYIICFYERATVTDCVVSFCRAASVMRTVSEWLQCSA